MNDSELRRFVRIHGRSTVLQALLEGLSTYEQAELFREHTRIHACLLAMTGEEFKLMGPDSIVVSGRFQCEPRAEKATKQRVLGGEKGFVQGFTIHYDVAYRDATCKPRNPGDPAVGGSPVVIQHLRPHVASGVVYAPIELNEMESFTVSVSLPIQEHFVSVAPYPEEAVLGDEWRADRAESNGYTTAQAYVVRNPNGPAVYVASAPDEQLVAGETFSFREPPTGTPVRRTDQRSTNNPPPPSSARPTIQGILPADSPTP